MIRVASPFTLRRAGIVGMNRRNVELIAQNNERRLFPLVDDKLKTKALMRKHGIDAPQLLGVVRQTGQINQLPEFLDPFRSFVIKPAQGPGGKGILVVVGREEDRYVKPSGKSIEFDEIRRHVNTTLSGLFSLGGRPDVAMIEALIDFDPIFV